MKSLLGFLSLGLPLLGWWGYGTYLETHQPQLSIKAVNSLPISSEKTLPFYELMSPLPSLTEAQVLPRLEYKKGPPERFIEKIILEVKHESLPSERIVYFGRRTLEPFSGISLLGLQKGQEGKVLELALRLSQGESSALPYWKTFLLKPLLLKFAYQYTQGMESVSIMDHSGSPAFLFSGKNKDTGKETSTALFFRRNSAYRVQYVGEKGFQILDPTIMFRKTFLTEKREDALDFLAQNLSQVKLEQKSVQWGKIEWPILLLAANVSLDPSSVEAYFHFAGISALLYRSLSGAAEGTMDTLDILRNNVLASEFYAKDVRPEDRKTLEIGRLSRILTRNLE